MDDLYLLLLLL